MLTIEIEQSKKEQEKVERKESNVLRFALFGIGLMIGLTVVRLL